MDQEKYVAIHGVSPRLTQAALHLMRLEMREAGWPSVGVLTPRESGLRESESPRIVADIKEWHDTAAPCEPFAPGHRDGSPHPSHISDATTDFQYDGSDYTPPVKGPASTTRWSWPRINRRQKSDCESEPASDKKQAWEKHREWVRGRLNHDGQLHQAVQRAQEKDRRLELGRPAYGTIDVDAISDAPSWATARNESLTERKSKDVAVPNWLPQHQHVHDAKTMAQYMAASAYTISLGGPPLPDMQYGIIIVPLGEEELFFKQPEEASLKRPSAAPGEGAAHLREPSLYPGSETSMGSTAFRFFNKQRLLETWEEDRWNAQLREQRRGLRAEDLLAPPDPWDDSFTDCVSPELQPCTSQKPDIYLQWDTDAPSNACATSNSGSLLK